MPHYRKPACRCTSIGSFSLPHHITAKELTPITFAQTMGMTDETPDAYVINLDRRGDRLTRVAFEMQNSGFKWKRISAVDGSLEKLPTGWPAGNGAYGCMLSHRTLLETAPEDPITVFEDDATVVLNFKEKYKEFMALVPDDWDAIFLGGQHIDTPTLVKPGLLKCRNTHRTHAYRIRGKYRKFLTLKWHEELGHIDHIWGRHQKDWKVYAPEKWLCGQFAGRSDINGREQAERYWNLQGRKFTPHRTCRPCSKKTP